VARRAKSQAEVWGNAMRAFVAQACRDLATEILAELIAATPIDTGHATVNWVVSIGTPYMTEVHSGAAQQAGMREVQRYELGDGAIYISNNAPYISDLNNGSSLQAPSLFVEACVDRAYARVQAKYEGQIDLGRGDFVAQVGGRGAGNLAAAFSPFG
jgi:hypothetical protein